MQISKRLFLLTISYWLATALGLALWSRHWEIVRLGAVKTNVDLFGIFSFFIFCAITWIAYVEIKHYKVLTTEALILIGLPYLVCLTFLAQITDLSSKSWDYKQYEAAFTAIVNDTNPYLGNRYLYPPVFADMMVFVYRIGLRAFPLLGIGKSEWTFVFYIHQSALLFFLLLSYFLSIEFSRLIGLKHLKGLILISAIYLLNVPILRTFSFNQVNFYILASILIVLVFIHKYPFIAGIFATLGGLIKIYPFVLSIPIFFMKKWKAITGMLFGLLVVVFIQTDFFQNFELWKQFYDFYRSFPIEQESSMFRNSSPMSFFRNTIRFLGIPDSFINVASFIVILTVLTWFAIRFYQREKMWFSQNILSMDLEYFRATGHLLDFSVISLLIAPSAWEHHYVIAIPLAIFTVAIRGKDAPIQTMIGYVLVFALPVFNIYPFSYLRLVGIIFLLILTSPQKIKQSFDSFQSRSEEIQLLTDH